MRANVTFVMFFALSILGGCPHVDTDTGTDTHTGDTSQGNQASVTVQGMKLGVVENCIGNFEATSDQESDVSHVTTNPFELVKGATYNLTVGDESQPPTSYGLPVHTDTAGYKWITPKFFGYEAVDDDVISATLTPYFGGSAACTRDVYFYDANNESNDFKGDEAGMVHDPAQYIEVQADGTVTSNFDSGMGIWGDEDRLKIELKTDTNTYHLVLHDEAPTYGISITKDVLGKASFSATVVDPDNAVTDWNCTLQ